MEPSAPRPALTYGELNPSAPSIFHLLTTVSFAPGVNLCRVIPFRSFRFSASFISNLFQKNTLNFGNRHSKIRSVFPKNEAKKYLLISARRGANPQTRAPVSPLGPVSSPDQFRPPVWPPPVLPPPDFATQMLFHLSFWVYLNQTKKEVFRKKVAEK